MQLIIINFINYSTKSLGLMLECENDKKLNKYIWKRELIKMYSRKGSTFNKEKNKLHVKKKGVYYY